MSTPRIIECKCRHSHADHAVEGFAPQCTAQHCTCLQYRPATAPAVPAAPARPPLQQSNVSPMRPEPAVSVQGERAPTTDDILRAGKRSDYPRTVKLTEKIALMVHDLRGRLQDEREATEAKRIADQAKVAQRAAVADLERRLAEAKAALRGTAPVHVARSVQPSAPGEHVCTRADCDRTFASSQARAMRERRAHDGFDPKRATA